jgi:hypothetical protein
VDSCTGLAGPWAHYVNEFGHAVLSEVSYSIGGQVIDTLYSHYLHMYHELTDTPGHTLKKMVGK